MKELTKGNPFKLILLFALPVLGGCVIQQLYSMVDTIIVGNTVGANALTGVGATGSITFLIIGFANGVTAGFGVRIAQKFGAGDGDGVRRAIAMSYTLSGIIAVVMTAIAVPLTGPLLRLINVYSDYFDYAYYYLLVVFAGMAATIFYNLLAGVMRAVGDSKTPLIFLAVSAVLNIGFDFAFVVGLHMNYTGAALATVLSQLLSGIACQIYMIKRYPQLRLRRGDFKWNWRLAGGHLAVGLPMALQFSITAIGCIVQQGALYSLEEGMRGVATGYSTACKLDNLFNQTFAAIGTAAANFAGQNCGAGRYDRVRKGVFVSLIYCIVAAVIGFAFCMGLCKPLMRLFINTDLGGEVLLYYDDILNYGQKFLFYQSAFYLPLGIVHIYRNAIQGIGKSAITIFSGIVELGARILAAFLFVSLWGYTGFCLSNPTAWVAADVFLVITYYVVMRGKGRVKRQNKKEHPRSLPDAA